MGERDPLPGVPNHDGSPREPADLFFAPPDPTIGALISASTSVVRVGQDGNGWTSKVERRWWYERWYMWAFVGAFAGHFVGIFSAMLLFDGSGEDFTPWILWTLLWAAIGAVCGVRGMRHYRGGDVTYVGERGLARYQRRGRSIKSEVIAFADVADSGSMAAALGRPTETLTGDFSVFWAGADGRKFVIWGRGTRLNPVPVEYPHHFARAAIAAWQKHGPRRPYR